MAVETNPGKAAVTAAETEVYPEPLITEEGILARASEIFGRVDFEHVTPEDMARFMEDHSVKTPDPDTKPAPFSFKYRTEAMHDKFNRAEGQRYELTALGMHGYEMARITIIDPEAERGRYKVDFELMGRGEEVGVMRVGIDFSEQPHLRISHYGINLHSRGVQKTPIRNFSLEQQTSFATQFQIPTA